MREQCPDCNKWSDDLPRHLAETCKERYKVRTPMKRTGIKRKKPRPRRNHGIASRSLNALWLVTEASPARYAGQPNAPAPTI